MSTFEKDLADILLGYKESFSHKNYGDESEESDVLMEAFGITQELKKENKQYWGRELGMCWQMLVTAVFRKYCRNFSPPKKYGDDEPADFFAGKEAVDTKYRVGSGDSGTLKKFKQYGKMLMDEKHTPVFLFLRNDNLPAAITACKAGGWTLYTGDASFKYIFERTGFDLKKWLVKVKDKKSHFIKREK